MHDDPGAIIELDLPSDSKYLGLVRNVVAAAAAVAPTLSDARIGDLKLVVTELITNAMEANWRMVGDSEETVIDSRDRSALAAAAARVRLHCLVRDTEIEVTVSDSGAGFDAANEPHPPVEDPERLEFERGLGLPLIQYLADEVDYASTGEGTRATVVLRDELGRSALG